MTLVNQIAYSMAVPIGLLAAWLQDTHGVDPSVLLEKWEDLTGMEVTIDEESRSGECLSISSPEKVVVSLSKSPPSGDEAPKTYHDAFGHCKHVFLVGSRKGERCCTKPKSGDWCSAHKKRPLKEAKPPAVKKSKEFVSSDCNSTDDEKDVPSVKKDQKNGDSSPEEEAKPVPKASHTMSDSSDDTRVVLSTLECKDRDYSSKTTLKVDKKKIKKKPVLSTRKQKSMFSDSESEDDK
jgi:hypothetical protein